MPLDDAPRRKRRRRFELERNAHALTFRCFNRRPFLGRERARRWFVEALDAARRNHAFHLWAYVVMPEHVHLLVQPLDGGSSVAAILTAVKLSVAKRAVAYLRDHAPDYLPRLAESQPDGTTKHRFWMPGGGFDRNVWGADVVRFEVDYIHANPVRRRLCERPTDWE